ncbi:type I phosphomannose isomerase catalytic subunit [Mesomycoplasma lagogenitalium]|uniref:Class I mannose-6-phosphate isomerase n=1 Tax=Mesomycoplasma lagogenitalium TaxID=171286 RepID=A0ABY8LUB9_9BACT|nr:type I phosphomannose isomerase catalytic subunit [Mesomycoplasma lagogenitalium]WGI36829.1 class I mannose-6-phosphate isomerase [Mesomycoplasma lagogenitalium]
MKDLVFLKPYLKETIWANDNLKKIFKTKKNIGEAWLISAVPGCESIVIETGETLSQFYKNNRSFFGYKKNKKRLKYPNLVKFIDAKEPLSIQVHPNNEYAKQFNSIGKDEWWYVLKNENDPFILGTNLKTKAELQKAIENNTIENYLNKFQLKVGDYVYIKAGLIHAIPKNTMVFEMQQNSDITYRIYDYNRTDEKGNKRELHLNDALNVVDLNAKISIKNNITHKDFLGADTGIFLSKIFHEKTDISILFKDDFWKEIIILEGKGIINDLPFKKGDAILASKRIKELKFESKNVKFLINWVQDLY